MNVRVGALCGISTWGAFATVEFADSTLRQILSAKYDLVTPAHWYFSAILLSMYLVAGALWGALASYILSRLVPARTGETLAYRIQPAVTLSLAGFYIVNLIVNLVAAHRSWRRSDYAAVAIGLFLAIVAAAIMGGRRQRKWARVVCEPWVAATLLMGSPWLADSLTVRNGAAFLLALAIATIVSLYLSPFSRTSEIPVRQLLAGVAAVAAIVGITLVSTSESPVLKRVAVKSASTGKRPNVVVIVMDTVRADHLSLYGYSRDTTPHLKRFAAGATTYRRAVAVCNWTLPSHASLFTGLYPRAHGAGNSGQAKEKAIVFYPLAQTHQTLAEVLTEAGYETTAVVANAGFLSPSYGLTQGFQLVDARFVVPWQPVGAIHYPRQLMRSIMDRFLWTLEFDEVTRRAENITTDAIRLLEEGARREQPVFLFVNYMDAHEPYIPPHPFDTMFPGKNRKMTRSRYERMVRQVIGRQREISEEEHEHYTSQYDGAIRYMDHEIDRLIGRLKELRLYDDTIIVVTSDHGEAFGAHNFMGHGQSLYQMEICLPLVIKYAGQQSGSTEDLLVSHVDVMPTIIAAAGLGPPQGVHGQNLLATDRDNERAVFAESTIHSDVAMLRPGHPASQFAIFRDNVKLIFSSNNTQELYDLSNDPEERRNLHLAEHSTAQDLHARLTDWLDRIPKAKPPRKPVHPRTLERLRALGYVQ